jgi:hypothetical protein
MSGMASNTSQFLKKEDCNDWAWVDTCCRVVCMGCSELSPRQPFQEQLAQLNPEAAEAVRKIARAGPDAEAARRRSLRVGAGEPDNSRVGAAHAMLAAMFPI